MPEPTNVVLLNSAATISEPERANRLLWTENAGKGWKVHPIQSSDSQYLAGLSAAIQERQRPADRPIIIAILARLANYYGGDRSPESWRMMFDDYAEDLAGISEAHLRDIAADHRKVSKWFPKVAEITEAWNLMKYREGEQLRRARVLLGHEQPKPWEAA